MQQGVKATGIKTSQVGGNVKVKLRADSGTDAPRQARYCRTQSGRCPSGDVFGERVVERHLRQEVATDGVRKATQSHASESPVPGEVRNPNGPTYGEGKTVFGSPVFTVYVIRNFMGLVWLPLRTMR
jgi:hypothetical protein